MATFFAGGIIALRYSAGSSCYSAGPFRTLRLFSSGSWGTGSARVYFHNTKVTSSMSWDWHRAQATCRIQVGFWGMALSYRECLFRRVCVWGLRRWVVCVYFWICLFTATCYFFFIFFKICYLFINQSIKRSIWMNEWMIKKSRYYSSIDVINFAQLYKFTMVFIYRNCKCLF